MNCYNRKPHQFVEIQSRFEDVDIEQVVRWCEVCGGVVVDLDCDGRTKPGAIMPFMSPNHRLQKR